VTNCIFPPKTAWIYSKPQKRQQWIDHEEFDKIYLAENKSIPESMRVVSSLMKVGQFCWKSFVKQSPFQTWYISTDHSSLVDSIEYSRDWREEIGSQDLGILQEAQRISSEVTDSSTNRDCAKFANPLFRNIEYELDDIRCLIPRKCAPKEGKTTSRHHRPTPYHTYYSLSQPPSFCASEQPLPRKIFVYTSKL